MKSLYIAASIWGLAGLIGCGAAAVPQELSAARAARVRAASGPAASLNPTDLHQAQQALDRAERSFDENGDAQVTRDLSYAAERQFEAILNRYASDGPSRFYQQLCWTYSQSGPPESDPAVVRMASK